TGPSAERRRRRGPAHDTRESVNPDGARRTYVRSGGAPSIGRSMSAPQVTNGHGFAGAPVAPPQNLEAEQSVLGAVLLSDTALPALIIDERLNPEDFYRESHAR